MPGETGAGSLTDDLGLFADLLQEFIGTRQTRYPIWDISEWTLRQADQIEACVDARTVQSILLMRRVCFPYLLLLEDQIPDATVFSQYLHHSVEEIFFMHEEFNRTKKPGRPPTASRECKRILVQRYPNGRPDKSVNDLLKEVNDALRSSPNYCTPVTTRTLHRVMKELNWKRDLHAN